MVMEIAILVWGCRSFLTPYVDEKTNKPKYYGRFNQGVVTINLVDVALSSEKDMDKFWKIFDERLELCHKALQVRHERLSKVTSDVAPILWQNGSISKIKERRKYPFIITRRIFNNISRICWTI